MRRQSLGVACRCCPGGIGRYDAEATVAVLAAQLKDVVDLDSLRADLANAVQKALEPAHISVWISPRD
jgi:hypothetical protein